MAKTNTVFSCQTCGYQTPKWLGRCPDCGSWNSFVEEVFQKERSIKKGLELLKPQPPVPICDIEVTDEHRVQVGIAEFDRVLGGGIAKGSLILIGGDPGIGKSTLLLQAMEMVASQGLPVLYVSGEESARQTRMRAERLGVTSRGLYVAAETSLETILEEVKKLRPTLLVIDSIQTIFTTEIDSAPGSISQVRECAGRLMQLSKGTGVSTFLIGHVTKEGAIAGPRLLEHMVDTVIYFEGERGHAYRILRAVKNRYGSTNEIGVFEMTDAGLKEVSNPSEIFLAERPLNASGSTVVTSLEGTRPILVELQALVSSTNFAVPRRTTIGVDHNRVSLLVAVLEKKVGLNLINQDIYVNVAGGVKIDEPAVDLGIITAIASSFLDKPVDPKTVIIGEIGLTGEIRGVAQAELRVGEAAKLGFTRCILPSGNKLSQRIDGIEVVPVGTVREAMEILF
ncbi:MAG: DNA repair protein RadA [Deltaproteobacteria bacterium]|nr:DNA repair protein RadA [Deltaproteobacteria bacterium]